VGVQIVGDDYASAPPAHALANRGIINNVVGYSVYGDYAQPNPSARIMDGVIRGDVDVAIVWGPLAGYFAQRSSVPLELRAVQPQIDPPYLPMVFDISMAVRRGDTLWHRRLNQLITERRPAIDSILTRYGVPRVSSPGTAGAP
jgi:mxaJ protein